jgi:hypothetical protein
MRKEIDKLLPAAAVPARSSAAPSHAGYPKSAEIPDDKVGRHRPRFLQVGPVNPRSLIPSLPAAAATPTSPSSTTPPLTRCDLANADMAGIPSLTPQPPTS